METDEAILQKTLTDLKEGTQAMRQIQFYSRPALIILRYLDLTTPMFSKGGAAGELLMQALKEKYTALWNRLTELEVLEPEERGTYLPEKFPPISVTKWKRAVKESQERMGRVAMVYNPKVAAIFRYNMQTIPRYKMSTEAAKLIEEVLEKRYPEEWAKAKTASE
jgi:hypothetical protein